jgi:DNA (cytosine-5)-methyltransferase 1
MLPKTINTLSRDNIVENAGAVFRAIDLFAGIGGMRIGFQRAFKDRIRFVYSNDNNLACCKTYEANFGKGTIDSRDIDEVIKDINQVPDHEILLAGFPCQPFSIAGEQKGFDDEKRGNLFYSIATILHEKKPSCFLLENVSFFEHHDKGKTWNTVRAALEKEDYIVHAHRLNARFFGVPQNRPRFFMAGFKEEKTSFEFPSEAGVPPPLRTILESHVEAKHYLGQKYLNSLKEHRRRHEEKGHGFGYRVLDPEKDIAHALVVGGMGRERNLIKNTPPPGHWQPGDTDMLKKNIEGIRRLTPRECARLQGFPEDFKIPVSDTQAYRQFPNSVAVPVIEAIANSMLGILLIARNEVAINGQLVLNQAADAK